MALFFVEDDVVDVAYGTDAGFTAYHTARGRDVSQWTTTQIAAARLVATEWLDATFRDVFSGWKVAPYTQEREWPRTGVIDYYGYPISSASVPAQIERATYEAALRELQAAGGLTPDSTPSKYKSVSIEGAISVVYGSQDASALAIQMPIIAQILSALLYGPGAMVSGLSGGVVRA